MQQCTYGYQTVLVGAIEYPVASTSTCSEVDVAADQVVVRDYISLIDLALLVGIFCAILWPRSSIKR